METSVKILKITRKLIKLENTNQTHPN